MALKNLKRKNAETDEQPAEEVTMAQAVAEDQAAGAATSIDPDGAVESASIKTRTPGIRWNKERDKALVTALLTVGGEDPDALVEAVNSSEAFAGAPPRTIQHIRSRRNFLQETVLAAKGVTLPEIAVKRNTYTPPADELVSLFQGVEASGAGA